MHLWKEGLKVPIISYTSPSSLISGCWSPTRASLFFLSRADGKLEIWDLSDNCYEPIGVQNVSSSGLCCVSVFQYSLKTFTRSQYVAIGDDDGTLHVLEVPRNLAKPSKNEVCFKCLIQVCNYANIL
jgi:WD40 repeat protein